MENTVNEKRPILDVENLRVSYHTYAGEVQSVRVRLWKKCYFKSRYVINSRATR